MKRYVGSSKVLLGYHRSASENALHMQRTQTEHVENDPHTAVSHGFEKLTDLCDHSCEDKVTTWSVTLRLVDDTPEA